MKVHIRKRKNTAGDKYLLSLEVYKGYLKKEDGTIKNNRTTSKLDYYLYVNPKTPQHKTHNKEVEKKVEIIRAEKEKDYLNGKYGFKSETKVKANFIDYFKRLTDERLKSKGNYGNWDSALKHLIKYSGESISFQNVDLIFCEGFREYLQVSAKKSNGQNLSDSSVNSYLCKLRASLNQAVDDGIILVNPALKVSTPRVIEKERAFLTLEEVQRLFKTECRYDVLKRAFLFSCLTGLRWSDIQKLEWKEFQKEDDNWKIVYHQKKTKSLQYQYISQQAKELLGIKTTDTERVFVGLKYSAYMNTALMQWCLKAGITKHITFHCGRHTYAVLQLSLGTDIFAVSKLLGHKEIKTTQIYAKLVDQKQKEAATVIPTFEV
ncbi:tyrosine-type recombinase/integrase [Flavobacterium beibuense]|uniref:tyrosine-type recombinase/integrase n=1 Tax=Flavobacterium beibuense TaxID=657326 RepID=UPI003A9191EF